MVMLRAEENRYILLASGREEAIARRIPGMRRIATANVLHGPRHPGVILALDMLFGRDGWECPAELVAEVHETRGREVDRPTNPVHVSLAGNELSIECQFADKELVKLVPGYRWSAPQRRWFVPAAPLALEILKEHVGDLLELEADVETFVELKRQDEVQLLARAERAAANIAVTPPPTDEAQSQSEVEARELPDATDRHAPVGESLAAQVARLAGAVSSLETILERLLERLPETVQATELPAEAPSVPESVSGPPADSILTELLGEMDSDPATVVQRANVLLQQSSAEAQPAIRAVLGIAASRTNDHQGAVSHIRRAFEQQAYPLDRELADRANDAYLTSVMALISDACGPAREARTRPDLEELVLGELVRDEGFDDTALASSKARDVLEVLMNDQHLRRLDPTLSDHCRVLHLLCGARGGRWMASDLVVDMLRTPSLTEEGFALGLLVLANTVFEKPCLDEWLYGWPEDASALGLEDVRWICNEAQRRLAKVDSTLATQAALALFGLLAPAPAETASNDLRRDLVKFIPVLAPHRTYAEFLAGFQLAAEGQKKVAQYFPGYLETLARQPLSLSAGHLMTVAVNGSGGSDSTMRRIAEEVYLPSLKARGVQDPQAEVLDLLDLLAESPKADNLLNEIAGMVEDSDFPGASSFSHKHRLELFTRALEAAMKHSHDQDSQQAFDRLLREHRHHGESEALRTLCNGKVQSLKPLTVPANQALLSLQLEAGEEFEQIATGLLKHANLLDPADDVMHEFKGLAMAFPAFREFLQRQEPERFEGGATSFERGKRIVVVGGHEWLRKYALPRFEEWGVKAEWLDPGAAKNGAQSLDLARGSADLIVVNTACISHAASGRVTEEAKKAGTKYVIHGSRGVGALLSVVAESLADPAPAIGSEPNRDRAAGRRKLLR